MPGPRIINPMLTGLAFSLLVAANCDRDPSVIKLAQPSVTDAAVNHLVPDQDAVVAVTIDSSGKVTSTRIYQTSGVPLLDSSALDAAKRSTYAPGLKNCAASGGTFAVAFSFVGSAFPARCPRDASVIALAETPDAERLMGTAPVSVRVTIGADGEPIDVRIVQSSYDMEIDRAAVEIGRLSTYSPKMIPVRRQASEGQTASETAVDCQPVTGIYLMKFNWPHSP